MATSRFSWGLTALAATSTLAAWLVYNHFRPKTRKKDNCDKTNDDNFDFFGSKYKSHYLQRSCSDSASSLESNEIEQVWTSNGEVDLTKCRQLLEQKKRTICFSSKVALFSHLLTKLEQTLDERNRIEYKLDNLRETGSPKQVPANANLPDQLAVKIPPAIQPKSDVSICLVVQRYRGATIMCSDNEIIRVGKPAASLTTQPSSQAFCGLMVYASFAKGCTQQAAKAASKIVVNLPIMTTGAWGDGSNTMNVVDLAKQHENAASILIVPQASLINKVKNQGKSIQYHGQIDQDEGKALFQYFVNSVRGLVLEQQCQARNEVLPEWYQKSCAAQSGSSPQKASPSIPPENLFRDTSLYASWDDNGIPLTDAEDELITKSAQKKLRKAMAAHRVHHLKWLRDHRNGSGVEAPPQEQPLPHEHIEHWATAIDPSFVRVVAGTFGKRQSLEFVADMGPFCHVIQL